VSQDQPAQSDRVKGFFSLFGAAFIYGTFGVLIRYISPMFGDNFQVFVRFSLAFIIMALFLAIRKKSMVLPLHTLLRALVLGFVFVLDRDSGHMTRVRS
jgi:drug/metabolite transporter (DMT)-like permease